MTLHLGLKRDFTWQFLIADVSKPVIGADLVHHYGLLLVDIKNRKLIDQETNLISQGHMIKCSMPSVRVIDGKGSYNQFLLAEYPEITSPDGRTPTVNHHIN